MFFFYLIERMNYYNTILKMYFGSLNMPINVFGNSNSNDNNNKIDTSLFVQKPYLIFNYIESNIEEDIDLNNQNRIKTFPDPISIGEAASKMVLLIN